MRHFEAWEIHVELVFLYTCFISADCKWVQLTLLFKKWSLSSTTSHSKHFEEIRCNLSLNNKCPCGEGGGERESMPMTGASARLAG